MSARLTDPKLAKVNYHLGVEIGLNIVCRVAQYLPEEERRAMIWLSNFSRLQRTNTDRIAERLGMERRLVRLALTDPREDRTAFVAAVRKLRAEFEAGLTPLVETSISRKASAAVRYADRHNSIVECVGPSRMGKTVAVKQEWYKRLDRAVYLQCPTSHGERELQNEIARALGISIAGGKNGYRVRAQVESCFSPDLISLVILDEAHRLWPRNPKENSPKRIEYVRSLHRDGDGASVLIVATPQFSVGLLAAMDNNPRWSPDQWYGRRVPFYTPETMSKAELTEIARHHSPDFAPELIELLVAQALASEGFAGLIVNTISLARDNAEDAGERQVSKDILVATLAQMARGSRLEAMLKKQGPPHPAPVPRFNGSGHPPAAPAPARSTSLRV